MWVDLWCQYIHAKSHKNPSVCLHVIHGVPQRNFIKLQHFSLKEKECSLKRVNKFRGLKMSRQDKQHNLYFLFVVWVAYTLDELQNFVTCGYHISSFLLTVERKFLDLHHPQDFSLPLTSSYRASPIFFHRFTQMMISSVKNVLFTMQRIILVFRTDSPGYRNAVWIPRSLCTVWNLRKYPMTFQYRLLLNPWRIREIVTR
jgi:hypothetical protein